MIHPNEKCDVCDKRATSFARDVVREENRQTSFYEYSTIGELKRGCEEHPVLSNEFETREAYAAHLARRVQTSLSEVSRGSKD